MYDEQNVFSSFQKPFQDKMLTEESYFKQKEQLTVEPFICLFFKFFKFGQDNTFSASVITSGLAPHAPASWT